MNMDVFEKLRAKRDKLDDQAESLRVQHNASTDPDERQRLSSDLAQIQQNRAKLADEFQEARDVSKTLPI